MLCDQSVTHRDGDFITMLAPIRLYISGTYNGSIPDGIPLLSDVESYYGAQLQQFGKGKEGGPGFNGPAWIKTEDVNVE